MSRTADTMARLAAMFSILVLLGAGCATKPPAATPIPISVPEPKPAMETPPASAFTPDRGANPTLPTVRSAEELAGKRVRLATTEGDIEIELFGDTAPIAVSNFLTLIERGYYDGLTFHRREEGFVVQGGDPKGNGSGGPGYTFADELKDAYTYKRGIVAMANRGPATNGSQFFIMLSDYPLPKNYTIFGRVVSGMDAVDAIKVGDKMTKVTVL